MMKAVRSKEIPWEHDAHGFDVKVLWRDQTSGEKTVLRRYPAGLVIAAHSHPHATEIKFILSGRWEVGGQLYDAGDLLVFPRGELQGPHHIVHEVLALTTFDGPS
jgi:quercetin dioxygenase-like cupin family protein